MPHRGSKPYVSKPGHKRILSDLRGKPKTEADNKGILTAMKNRLKRK